MPTFDFQCAACDHVFEFTRPFGSKTNPKCPACGSKKTVKLIAPPAVHFKGPGWYKNDSKTPSTPQKSAPKADEKKSEEKTESKPEKVAPPAPSKKTEKKD